MAPPSSRCPSSWPSILDLATGHSNSCHPLEAFSYPWCPELIRIGPQEGVGHDGVMGGGKMATQAQFMQSGDISQWACGPGSELSLPRPAYLPWQGTGIITREGGMSLPIQSFPLIWSLSSEIAPITYLVSAALRMLGSYSTQTDLELPGSWY